MNNIKSYIKALAIAAAATLGFSACQDDFDDPNLPVPEAKNKPTISIAELKALYWQEDPNYAITVAPWSSELADKAAQAGVNLSLDEGQHLIVSGVVLSSDEAGNVFKNLVIFDGTAALPLSINSYNLYLKYRRGQEIVLDLTGMDIGKYNGYMQVGKKEWYEKGQAWEVSFMAPETFTRGVELNGLPDLAKVDTLQIQSFDQLPATPAGLQTYQGRLVRFNNVAWQNGGVDTYSTYHSSGVSQNIVDTNGATLAARTSGYSNFWNQTLPEGRGDVVCILGYYGSAWQLTLLDGNSSMNFGNPTVAPGDESNPYSVAEAVAIEEEGKTATNVWVKGYIVGTVAPEVENITSDADIEWGTGPTLSNTVVIASDPASQNIAECIVLALPTGSTMREWVNIQAHPDNVGRLLTVRGNLEKYMGTFGLTGNRGTKPEFKLDGVEIPDEPDPTPDPTPGPDGEVTVNPSLFPVGESDNSSKPVTGPTTVGGYTLTTDMNGGATAPSVNTYNCVGTLRLYADNTLTIKGAAMSKIVFTLNTATGSKRYTTFTPSTGSIVPAQASGDTSITWDGNTGEVKFTVGHDATLGSDGASKRGQVHISSIEITPAE